RSVPGPGPDRDPCLARDAGLDRLRPAIGLDRLGQLRIFTQDVADTGGWTTRIVHNGFTLPEPEECPRVSVECVACGWTGLRVRTGHRCTRSVAPGATYDRYRAERAVRPVAAAWPRSGAHAPAGSGDRSRPRSRASVRSGGPRHRVGPCWTWLLRKRRGHPPDRRSASARKTRPVRLSPPGRTRRSAARPGRAGRRRGAP